jgi:hypothetical protein
MTKSNRKIKEVKEMGELNLDKIERALLQELEDKHHSQDIWSPDEDRETVEVIQSRQPVLV